MKEYIYYRTNLGDALNGIPMRLTEKEVRTYLAAVLKRVDGAVKKLQKGHIIETKYATYRAEEVIEKIPA